MQIRSGATAESVAESSGLPLAHVQRYEGPVLAEREYIARKARGVEVSAAVPAHDGYRSAFGDDPATLEDMVRHRLAAFGVDPATLAWDAWRRPEGNWTVIADFAAGPSGTSIGEPSPAQWVYNPGRSTIANGNRWAQQLSELEPLDGPLPARRLSAVADRPFDFESDAQPAADVPAEPAEDGKDGLLDMLRSRRGQRLGADENEDDALALLLSAGIPAAHPRPPAVPPSVPAEVPAGPLDGSSAADERTSPQTSQQESSDDRDDAAGTPARIGPRLSLAQLDRALESGAAGPPDTLALHDISANTREISIVASPAKESTPASDRGTRASRSEDDAVPRPERRSALKPKRSSVPSWDEIVFGTKGD
jgi:hypothetical protein